MKLHFLERWQQESPENREELDSFLSNINSRSDASLDERSVLLHKEVFAEIDCLECANCCKTTPAILTNQDIKRIAKFLQIPPKIFRKKYVLEDINGELSFSKVPCAFLEPDNTCTVYEVRPESCRDYPHTGSGSFRKRAALHRGNLNICPAAFEIVKRIRARLS